MYEARYGVIIVGWAKALLRRAHHLVFGVRIYGGDAGGRFASAGFAHPTASTPPHVPPRLLLPAAARSFRSAAGRFGKPRGRPDRASDFPGACRSTPAHPPPSALRPAA